MEPKQKSLQKFTEFKTRINNLLSNGRPLSMSYIKGLELNAKEAKYLLRSLYEKVNNLEGVERDNFINNVYDLIDDEVKNKLWEFNHNQITSAITTLIQEYNRMPSITEIAKRSELSRQTVHKHFSEYSKQPLYLEQIEQFRFLTSKLLAKVFHFAVNGDMGAAKLYFNVMGYLNGQLSNNTLIQNQNNYIQINGIILSQEAVKKLNSEQLQSIETILKTALPTFNIDEQDLKL